jgi:tRNA(Ile)-lysidine synthase
VVETAFLKVNRFVARHAMFEGSQGVVVAVSGGPDSVALLDILLRLPRETLSARLHVAHLDHLLRGCESAEDADFVRALAENLELQATIGSADVAEAARSSGRSIEEAAREIRYKFLMDVAVDTDCDRIAVGHTMTDQAETVVMRLLRGAGTKGLAAMRPVTGAHKFSSDLARRRRSGGAEGRESPSAPLPLGPSAPLLIRPLLCITREEVEEYCRSRALDFRTDVTNETSRYTRNRVRNEIFPALKSINPRVVEAIARAADNLAGDQDALQHHASSVLDQSQIDSSAQEMSAAYSAAALTKQPAGMRRRMIIEALKRLRFPIVETEHKIDETTSIHVADIERLLKRDASGKSVTLPNGIEVWREFDALVFKFSKETSDPQYRVEINSQNARVEAGGFVFAVERAVPGESLNEIAKATRREARVGRLDWMTVAINDRALPDHLFIRPRLPGERALVAGHTRTKKLKNLMIEHRIPSSRRATWPIVTTPSGCYVWSPGLPPALQFTARDDANTLAVIRATAV